MFAELRVDHRDLAVLDHEALDALHRLAGVVGDDDVGRDLLAVIVNLAVESHFQVDLALREGETLADQRRRQATTWKNYFMISF